MLVLVIICLLSLPPFTYAALHSLQYFYTATSGISGFPEFTGVGKVDDIEISYYDSNSNKAIPKQDWMKTDELDDAYWVGETHVAMGNGQNFKKDIGILKSRFNQTGGAHVLQKMYGCQWDEETQTIDGFERFGYDGEDFMFLDVKLMRWIAPTVEAQLSTNTWNSDVGAIEFRKYYFHTNCAEWLKKYVNNGQHTLNSRVPPEVSVLQRGTEVVCHVTGFYPKAVMITWKKDGVEMDDDVDVGETLPNEDGTFQKRATVTLSPEEMKKAQYSCEVTHRSGEPIVLIYEEEKKSSNIWATIGAVVAIAVLVGVVVAVLMIKKYGYIKASQSDTSSENSVVPLNASDTSSENSAEPPKAVDQF